MNPHSYLAFCCLLAMMGCASTRKEAPAAATGDAAETSDDWNRLKSASPKEQYAFLSGLDREPAEKDLGTLSREQIESLNDYILAEKGQKSGISWIFPMNVGLSDDERNFITWYLRERTRYKAQ